MRNVVVLQPLAEREKLWLSWNREHNAVHAIRPCTVFAVVLYRGFSSRMSHLGDRHPVGEITPHHEVVVKRSFSYFRWSRNAEPASAVL